MIVAALIDAGADFSTLRQQLARLGVAGYGLSCERKDAGGISANSFRVQLSHETKQPHRHLHHMRTIVEGAHLPPKVGKRAIRVFERLAEAEAKIHGTTIEKIHFHEVGAVDAIIDVVGAMLALELLGVERVVCSPVPVGSGTVQCAHGTLPVPAPATAELLKGVPLADCDEPGELTTPTAAAVLTTIADEFGPIPPMRISAIGYGAGTREGIRRPNVLRVLVGESVARQDEEEVDEVDVLECNLDDATPQLIGHCLDRLRDGGALDAYAVPIQMKKSRPGVLLSVLCSPELAADLQRILFEETTTLGIRRHGARRVKMTRRQETVATAFGEVRMKIGEWSGVVTATPEYEDCRRAAAEHGVALRQVLDAARFAWNAHKT